MTLRDYLDRINGRYRTKITSEHSFRGDLQGFLEEMLPGITVTNEPTRIACGAPDYILTKGDIPVAYVEAKDIGADIRSKAYKEQFDRYKASLDNLVITNYLDFDFFRNGELVASNTIGEIRSNGSIVGVPTNYDEFIRLIKEFGSFQGQTIKDSKKLAKMMAAKARLLADVIEKALGDSEPNANNLFASNTNRYSDNELRNQLNAFKQILIHDIGAKEFADIYAQTIAYGMFAARLHDPTLETFTRREAAELIPKSNPFLRRLFQYIAGYDLDDRIRWIVDALADIFKATDVAALLENFGKATQQNDPMIHFYETFLSEYDPKLRKSRGVWYTPEPVVNFIVRAVDDILKSEFDLPMGLADTSKIKVKVDVPGQKKSVEQEVHKVQILDPATGTGTFLAEVVKQIYNKFEGQQGIWSDYVENHLIPRLNGFEILMASYSMAHLKLDMLLAQTGYKPKIDQRFRVYLTNTLEDYHPDTGTLFAGWLSEEANEANHIKRDTPVMVVIGNPPYSGESSNKSKWIMELLNDYKLEPGGGEKLKERNPKWLNDDYVKFIRYGQFMIDKNGSGILAFINPHGYLDNPTFRGMRWSLLETFNKIFTIDLHGNSKKKETAPDGGLDENVFDIMQGVSINLFVKNKTISQETIVKHIDLFGTREYKYDTLLNNSVSDLSFNNVKTSHPMHYFVPIDNSLINKYKKGFSIKDLFRIDVLGFQSHRDKLAIDFTEDGMIEKISELVDSSIGDAILINKHMISENKAWRLSDARQKLKSLSNIKKDIIRVAYRPFDFRYAIYNTCIMDRPRVELKQHVQNRFNYCLNVVRQTKMKSWGHIVITNIPSPAVFVEIKDGSNVFPLYLYTNDHHVEQNYYSDSSSSSQNVNFNSSQIDHISESLGLLFSKEERNDRLTYSPIHLMDYIYSSLHSPSYREKYNDFLKIDFPRVPYPTNQDLFWNLVNMGSELRKIHLMEHPILDKLITRFPSGGSNEVVKIQYKDGRVYINSDQYFGGVSEIVWKFYIGGYQPAQKWLKDRKGRTLTYEDIQHYQRIIVALTETDRIMKEIDELDLPWN